MNSKDRFLLLLKSVLFESIEKLSDSYRPKLKFKTKILCIFTTNFQIAKTYE